MSDENKSNGDINISPGDEGDVNIGNVVGGDVHGDAVAGDKVEGDKVAGDKIDVAGDKIDVAGDFKVIFKQVQKLPRPFMIVVGAAVFVLVGLGVTNLQPVQVALFPTQTPTALPSPTPSPTPTPGPARMSNDSFNVVVAEIGQQGASSQVNRSTDGQQLSVWIFTELQREYESSDVLQQHDIQLWHDSLGPEVKDVEIGIVSSDDEAKDLADRVNANLIIYGNLTAEQEPATFEPEFYVSRLPGEADEISEITGPFQLGTSIPVPLPLEEIDQVSITALRQQVTLRARAMRWFTVGFIWDLVGDTAKALETFKQAELDLSQWAELGEGKEILYYFIGREALTLGRDDQIAQSSGAFENADQALQEAERYFRKALASDDQYARAHIGLAGVFYQRAQHQAIEDRLVGEELAGAIDHYDRAREYTMETPNGPAGLEARFGVGIAALLQGTTYRNLGFPDEANASLDWAIQELEMIVSPLIDAKQHRTLAQVHLALGVTYLEQARLLRDQGDIAASIDSYEQAQMSFARCVDQGDPGKGGISNDLVLKDIIARNCGPYSEVAAQDRAALEEEP
jgi:tetratricopeptide (TPR) repeat protein